MTEAKHGQFVVVKGPPGDLYSLAHIARLGRIADINDDQITVMFKEEDCAIFPLEELEILDWPIIEIEIEHERN